MPWKKKPCPGCEKPIDPRTKLCRGCAPPYERTPEWRARQAEYQRNRPRRTGYKRPGHSEAMKAMWTDPARKEAAAERMRQRMADPKYAAKMTMPGDKNPRWAGGLSASQYAPGFTKALKARIRERDEYTCQLCALTEAELGYSLTIHHTDYDKTNHQDDNLAATCKACNSRVNTNRDLWFRYFAALAERRGELGKNVGKVFGRQVVTQREGFISIRQPDAPDLSALFAGIESLS